MIEERVDDEKGKGENKSLEEEIDEYLYKFLLADKSPGDKGFLT